MHSSMCTQEIVYVIFLTAQPLDSPSFSPLKTSCHHIHILLLFSAPLPLHSGSVCNPFIVTVVWHWQRVRGQASTSLRKCLRFRPFHTIYVFYVIPVFTHCISSDMQHGCKRGDKNWRCEADKTVNAVGWCNITPKHIWAHAKYELLMGCTAIYPKTWVIIQTGSMSYHGEESCAFLCHSTILFRSLIHCVISSEFLLFTTTDPSCR